MVPERSIPMQCTRWVKPFMTRVSTHSPPQPGQSSRGAAIDLGDRVGAVTKGVAHRFPSAPEPHRPIGSLRVAIQDEPMCLQSGLHGLTSYPQPACPYRTAVLPVFRYSGRIGSGKG